MSTQNEVCYWLSLLPLHGHGTIRVDPLTQMIAHVKRPLQRVFVMQSLSVSL